MAETMEEMAARHFKEMQSTHTRHEGEIKRLYERQSHEVNGEGNPGEAKAQDKPSYDREDKGTTGTEPK